jgi:hypothetical protein
MRVSGFWSAIGLVITGLIVADLITHPTGTQAGFNGITGLSKNTGNQLLGVAA